MNVNMSHHIHIIYEEKNCVRKNIRLVDGRLEKERSMDMQEEKKELLRSDYYYDLPQELIAQDPLEDRSSSRLMMLDKNTGETKDSVFTDVINYLNPGDCLVINDTKVIPARLIGTRIIDESKPLPPGYQHGAPDAQIEVLLLKRKADSTWETLVRPGKKAKIGTKISFGDGLLIGEVVDIVEEGDRIVRFTYDGIFEEIRKKISAIPESSADDGEYEYKIIDTNLNPDTEYRYRIQAKGSASPGYSGMSGFLPYRSSISLT